MTPGSLDLETLFSDGIKGLSPKIQPLCPAGLPSYLLPFGSLCPCFSLSPISSLVCLSLSLSHPFSLSSCLHVIVWTSLCHHNNLSQSLIDLPPPTSPLVIEDSSNLLIANYLPCCFPLIFLPRLSPLFSSLLFSLLPPPPGQLGATGAGQPVTCR